MSMFEERNPEDGAYHVNTKEFEKIYQLLSRMNKRTEEAIQLILFTFTDVNGNVPNSIILGEVFKRLTIAVKRSLRLGDVATKYSDSQYIILLKGIRKENSRLVIRRIIEQYDNLGENLDIKLHYDMEYIK